MWFNQKMHKANLLYKYLITQLYLCYVGIIKMHGTGVKIDHEEFYLEIKSTRRSAKSEQWKKIATNLVLSLNKI